MVSITTDSKLYWAVKNIADSYEQQLINVQYYGFNEDTSVHHDRRINEAILAHVREIKAELKLQRNTKNGHQ